MEHKFELKNNDSLTITSNVYAYSEKEGSYYEKITIRIYHMGNTIFVENKNTRYTVWPDRNAI